MSLTRCLGEGSKFGARQDVYLVWDCSGVIGF